MSQIELHRINSNDDERKETGSSNLDIQETGNTYNAFWDGKRL